MHPLESKFKLHWESEFYMANQSRILVAVSGGADSVALAVLLHRLGIYTEWAHVNYGLRGEESNAEEAFVKSLADRWNIRLHIRRAEWGSSVKSGVQEQARNLRYTWFEELMQRHALDYTATAHQANDSIETFFLNLIRGAGLDGLTGIPSRHGKIIRPLQFAFRKEIENFLQQEGIPFCTDSSNLSDDYTRNFIRNQIIPLFHQLNPSFDEVMIRNMDNLRAAQAVYRQGILRLKTELVHFEPTLPGYKISMLELAGRNVNEQIMYELIREFDFNPSQAADMLDAIGGQSGLRFDSPTHRCVTSRGFFFIQPYPKNEEGEAWLIESPEKGSHGNFSWNYCSPQTIVFDKKNYTAFFHPEKLTFPLLVRPWHPGDKIQPLGMKGKKKISDLATDKKYSLLEKEKIWVVESGGEIIWVPGLCIADRVKVIPGISKCFSISYHVENK
ncbi:MAG: tRNA lysidine(34) synthetase TilS [Flavobacteriales bacterium]|nr:tRNA lysidine(34) synthetase TilS [Flavobacteriales bacterium]